MLRCSKHTTTNVNNTTPFLISNLDPAVWQTDTRTVRR